MRNAARVALLSGLVISAACGGGDSTGPSDHKPKTVTITAGSGQQAVAGTAVATAPAVTVKDAGGSVVSGVVVTFTVTAGGGSITGAVDTTDGSGIAHLGSWTLGTATGLNTISIAAGTLAPVSLSATAVAGPAASLAFTTAPSTTATNGQPLGQQPVLQLKDQFGNNVAQAGVSVVAAIASGGGSLGGTPTVQSNATGRVSFTNLAISGTAGAHTLSFTAAGLTALNSGAIALAAGPAASVVANSSVTLTGNAGAAVAPAPSVLVQDASGNPVAGASVAFAVATGGGNVTGAVQLSDASGIATVGSWTLGGTLGAQTLTATLTGLPAVTFTATAGPAAAARVAIVTQPSATAVNGVALGQQPVVRIEDGFGNLVTTATNPVTVTLQGTGVLGGTVTIAAVNGVVTFTNLAITGSVGNYLLVFNSAGLTGASSTGIGLTAGAAAAISLNAGNGQNAAVGTAVATPPSVLVVDGSGNPVAGVAVSFAVQPGGGSVTGGNPTSNASGIAAVGSWTLGSTAGGNTLTATAAGLAGSPVTFTATATPAAGSQLAITTQPSATAANGMVLAQQPVIQLRDQFNNPVNLAGVVVTATVASGGGSVSGGITATTNASGTATFSGLTLNGLVGTKTLGFSAAGVTSATSSAITLTAGAPTQLVLTTQPSATAANGVAFATQPVVRLEDVGGNFVLQSGTPVTVAIASGGGTLGGTATVNTDASGIAGFSGLSITGLAGNRTLSFTASGLTGATSNLVAITAGPASTIAKSAGDGQTAIAGSVLPTALAVQVTDQSGNPVSGVSVTFAVASGGGSISGGAATTNAAGIATIGSWTLGTAAGANTVTATSLGLAGSPLTFTATGTPAPASQLVITTQPSASAQNGVALAQQPVIQLRDQFGNDVAQGGVVVTSSVASGGGSVSGGTTATTNANGTASFSGLILNGLVGTKTLGFSAPGLTSATSISITLAAGAAAQVVMVTQPSATAANGAVLATQPVVRITDAGGNFELQAGISVTVAIASGGGSLGGTASANTDPSGIATFSGLSITGVAGNRTLSFSSGVLTPATSSAIAITAGAATTMAVSAGDAQTASAGSVLPTQLAVQITDVSGNPVSGVVVNFAVATGGGSISGATASSNAAGIATIGSWTLGTVAGPNSVTATSIGLANSPLTFTATGTPGTASQLVIATQPSANAQNGVALTQQPVLQLRDQFGNNVSQASVVVTSSVASGGGTVSGGTTATTNASGTASFSGLILNGLVGTKTLGFSATGLTPATSSNIALAAGAAAQVIMVTQPSATAANGAVLATQPVVRIADAGGNFVLQANVPVTAAIATGGGTLGGTPSVNTDASGVATFTGLSITGVAGNRTLSFSSSGLTPATSSAIAITAGAATTIAISAGDGQSAVVGAAVATPPAALVADQSGNPVSGVAVTFAVATGGGSLTGAAATSNASGIAAVGSWSLGNTVGANTLTATSTGLTGSPLTFTATATPAAPSALSITTQPPANAAVGAALSTQPVIQLKDQFGNDAAQAGVVVTASIFSGGGSVAGGTTATTTAGGVATFSGLIVNGTAATSQVLRFTSGSLTAVNSTGITLTAGAASQIAITTQPSNSVTNGSTLATQPVVQLKDAGGNNALTAGVSIVASVTGTPAGVTLGGTTTVVTNGSGVATYANLSLSGVAGSYTLTFAKSGLTSAVSGSIALLAGAPASLVSNSATSQSGRVGIAATTPPSVKVLDASGNPVSGVSVTFAVTAGGGSVSGATSTTSILGVATVGGWTLGKRVITNTVTATAGALPIVSFNASPTFQVGRVAGGGNFSCAVTIDGVPYCWGDNSNGRLGDGTTSPRTAPTPLSGNSLFGTINAGLGHACGITGAGSAFCWGANNNGQLGVGNTSQHLVATAVSGGKVFSTIELGTDHTCGITSGGAVDCWGANNSGQLGNGATSASPTTTPLQVVASGFSQVSSGVFFTCGTKTTGVGNCWGNNGFGQLGDSTKSQRTLPTLVKGSLIFAEVVSSQTHSCGRTSGGAVYCWGFNVNGRLAQDTVTVTENLVPRQVLGLSSVVQLTAGLAHTCARTSGTQVYCWGLNDSGQLGNGSFNNAQVATLVTLPGGVTGFTSISAGASHTCGVTSTGALYCWGDNTNGQLGDGSGSDQNLPVLVTNP